MKELVKEITTTALRLRELCSDFDGKIAELQGNATGGSYTLGFVTTISDEARIVETLNKVVDRAHSYRNAINKLTPEEVKLLGIRTG